MNVEFISGWCLQIKSKTAMKSRRKREFVDPSIAVAALGISPSYYLKDLKTFGFVFENHCIRDLKIYSQNLDGEISYYRDNLGLEAECVLHLNDGRYAIIEFKLGDFEIDDGAKHLNYLEKLIVKHSDESDAKIRIPDLKIVITGTKYGYKREDGVFVIPIGCLKD